MFWKHKTTQIRKKIRNVWIFSIFSEYLQYFLSFLLSLFWKNQSTFYSGNFFTWPWKIHILSLGSKLKKKAPQKLKFVLSFNLRKFEWILKSNLRGDRIFDGKSQKDDGLSHILEKIKHLSRKTLPQKFCILILQVMLKLRIISK